MVIRTCKVCGLQFHQKSHYDVHKNRKFKCKPPNILNENIQINNGHTSDQIMSQNINTNNMLTQNVENNMSIQNINYDIMSMQNMYQHIIYLTNKVNELEKNFTQYVQNNTLQINTQNIHVDNTINVNDDIINFDDVVDYFLTEEQKTQVLQKGEDAIPELFNLTYFNPNNKKFNNIRMVEVIEKSVPYIFNNGEWKTSNIGGLLAILRDKGFRYVGRIYEEKIKTIDYDKSKFIEFKVYYEHSKLTGSNKFISEDSEKQTEKKIERHLFKLPRYSLESVSPKLSIVGCLSK